MFYCIGFNNENTPVILGQDLFDEKNLLQVFEKNQIKYPYIALIEGTVSIFGFKVNHVFRKCKKIGFNGGIKNDSCKE